MLLHNGETTFYMQASTDFIIAAHPSVDILLERILESRNGRMARDAWERERSDAILAVPGVPAVPGHGHAVPAVASNVFDPEEKHEVKYDRTAHGLQVHCCRVPQKALDKNPGLSETEVLRKKKISLAQKKAPMS